MTDLVFFAYYFAQVQKFPFMGGTNADRQNEFHHAGNIFDSINTHLVSICECALLNILSGARKPPSTGKY